MFAIDQPTNNRTSGGLLILWFVSGAYFGAALLLPFRREFIGALLGFVVQLAILFLLALSGT
jgi:hypothetical protein